jgi:hypothetical protein
MAVEDLSGSNGPSFEFGWVVLSNVEILVPSERDLMDLYEGDV